MWRVPMHGHEADVAICFCRRYTFGRGGECRRVLDRSGGIAYATGGETAFPPFWVTSVSTTATRVISDEWFRTTRVHTSLAGHAFAGTPRDARRSCTPWRLRMSTRVRSRAVVACIWCWLMPALAAAQDNPLYEHRKSARNASPAMKSVEEASVVARVDGGRVTMNLASSRLMDAGVSSGDPLIVELGPTSFLVRVAFRDELNRAATYLAAAQRPLPVEPVPSLVIDREDPSQPVMLDTSTGGAAMYLNIAPGHRASLLSVRANASAPARAME